MKTKIIITGSCGLIGSAVTAFFKSKQEYEVIELDLALGHNLEDELFVNDFFKKNPAHYLINFFALNDHVSPTNERNDLLTVELGSIRQFLEVNVVALFSVCRVFAKNNLAEGIVNFSSTYGIVSPNPNIYSNREKHIGYSISKGAVIQLTRHLAVHLAPRVRVNCIAPGGVLNMQGDDFIKKYSQNTPLHRMMDKNELNGILQLLCSSSSSYMTGSIISVDGGWTTW